ncbi:MAG TPA: cob(I)yrinic acid a,c-diamide adenosyltransferase [Rectinemataceae bacterium]|nr:cob(I)yrinic acid a,c-diamide adenosyltransferase [Rectinemataceae bacterium]
MKATIGAGDRGRTGLLSGERVAKDDPRIEALGELDELNSFIGLLLASLSAAQSVFGQELEGIQADLFGMGAVLASSPASEGSELLDFGLPARTRALEAAMTGLEAGLVPLREFLLPGGHPAAAMAQVARSVCRRAERRVVALVGTGPEAETHYAEALAYLNRLSDYLFTLARACNMREGLPDRPWKR